MSKPNGLEQVEFMRKLCNPSQRAPSSAAWPEGLAGFKVGDTVDVPSIGRCLVVALIPPALLQITTESGALCKVGWKVARKVKQ